MTTILRNNDRDPEHNHLWARMLTYARREPVISGLASLGRLAR